MMFWVAIVLYLFTIEVSAAKKNVLIMQLTTEGFDRGSYEWNREKFPSSFTELSKLSAYWYAQRHGYDYKLFLLDDCYLKKRGRDNFWMKPLAIKRALELNDHFYDIVVYVDVDIIFMEPQYSIEEKMREWANYNKPTADIYIAMDVAKRKNHLPQYLSQEKVLTFNTGFIIFQNSIKARIAVQEWWDCPDKIAGCQRYRRCRGWGSDQAALLYLEKYFQYIVFSNDTFTIQRVSCDEVNGLSLPVYSKHQVVQNGNCSGRFTSHFWGPKQTAIPFLTPILLKHITSAMDIVNRRTGEFNSFEMVLFRHQTAVHNTSIDEVFTETKKDLLKAYDQDLFNMSGHELSFPLNLSASLDLSYPNLEIEEQTASLSQSYQLKAVDTQPPDGSSFQSFSKQTYPDPNHVLLVQLMNVNQYVLNSSDDTRPSYRFFALNAMTYAQFQHFDYQLFLYDDATHNEGNSHGNSLSPEREMPWRKTFLLEQLLTNQKLDYEWFLLVDAHLLFLELDQSLKDRLEEWSKGQFPNTSVWKTADMLCLIYNQSNDQGVWMIRNSLQMRLFFQHWNSFVRTFNIYLPLSTAASFIPTISSSSSLKIISLPHSSFSDFIQDWSILYSKPSPPIHSSPPSEFLQKLLLKQFAKKLNRFLLNHQNEELLPQTLECSDPWVSMNISLRHAVCDESERSRDCLTTLTISLSYPITIQESLENNYPDNGFYESLQQLCRDRERVDLAVCDYIQQNIEERIQSKYTFLLKREQLRNEMMKNPALFLPLWSTEFSNRSEIYQQRLNQYIQKNVFSNGSFSRSSFNVLPIKNAEFSETQQRILFVTAFKELGRENWTNYERSAEDYYLSFMNIANYLPENYRLIVFVEPEVYHHLWTSFPELWFKSHILFLDWYSVSDSFYQKYLTKETEIMRSPLYQEKIPSARKWHPEHRFSEYTMMTHSKISFIRRVYQLFPSYSYYAWIDFGHLRQLSSLHLLPTPELAWEKFDPERVIMAVNRMPDLVNDYYDAEQMLSYSGRHYFISSHMIFPAERILDFEELYEQKLLEWQEKWIADDEQNLILQLYQERSELFLLYQCPAYHLFANHLNVNSVKDE